MIEREFKVQVLETARQWQSGLWRRLALDGGISLFANPAFDSWLAVENWHDAAGDIVTDECGQVYWSARERKPRHGGKRRDWSLFRRNPETAQTERVLNFNECGGIEPRKMWIRRDYLWIYDSGRHRLLGLARENFQLVYEFEVGEGLIDIDLGGDSTKGEVFYVLVRQEGEVRICRYPTTPHGRRDCFSLQGWKKPVALAVGPTGTLFILDAELGCFIRYGAEGKEDFIGLSSENLLKGFVPSAMEIDARGVIYLASDRQEEPRQCHPAKTHHCDRATLHPFDKDGSYLGETVRDECGEIVCWTGIRLPERAEKCAEVTRIGGIGFDCAGAVYLATDLGLAKFSLTVTPVGQDGVYYSKTLDNGKEKGLWHRLAMRGLIPEKTSVEVYSYASDDTALKTAYDKALAADRSIEEKEAAIERLLGPLWQGGNTFSGEGGRDESEPDLLILENRGRFLWLKLRLITFDQGRRPSIHSVAVYYPRLSYLRYLPPAYREDPVSAAFLERFLSLFETVFTGLDREIADLYRYFDAGQAPAEFLRWLASWINLSIDEDLPEERVRQLIRQAPELYARKGTPAALTRFLEIYTGRPVSIVEYARGLRPLVIGAADLRLGNGTVLLGSGIKGFRLGDTSIVGYSAVRDRVRDADEPFLPTARRFAVLVDMNGAEFNRRAATLRRILDEQKPAHTACTLALLADRGGVGTATLGVNTMVRGTPPYRVGVSPLGSGFAVAKGPEAARLERGAGIRNRMRL